MTEQTVSREHLIKFTRRFIMNQYDTSIVGEENHHEQGHWFSGELEVRKTGLDLVKPDADGKYHICGSTGCVAGWGALFAGWMQIRNAIKVDPSIVEDEKRYYGAQFEKLHKQDRHGDWWYQGNSGETVVNPANGEVASMRDAAKEEFGLNDTQADALFAGNNTIEKIDILVDAFLADRNANLYELSLALDSGFDSIEEFRAYINERNSQDDYAF